MSLLLRAGVWDPFTITDRVKRGIKNNQFHAKILTWRKITDRKLWRTQKAFLDLLSEYLLIVEFRFGAVLCFAEVINFLTRARAALNGHTDTGRIKWPHGHRFHTPDSKEWVPALSRSDRYLPLYARSMLEFVWAEKQKSWWLPHGNETIGKIDFRRQSKDITVIDGTRRSKGTSRPLLNHWFGNASGLSDTAICRTPWTDVFETYHEWSLQCFVRILLRHSFVCRETGAEADFLLKSFASLNKVEEDLQLEPACLTS